MLNTNFQSRKYHITINNPHKYCLTSEKIREILSRFHYLYYCMCEEKGELGTLHVHIYIIFNSPVRFSTLKNAFPVAHIENAHGTSIENRNYIRKEGKWATSDKANTVLLDTFYESGELPTANDEKYPQMVTLQHELVQGLSTAQIVKTHPNLGFKIDKIDALRQTLLSEEYSECLRTVEVTYVFGPSGCGKTSMIYKKYPYKSICRITNYDNLRALFDTYNNEDILVFEEFRSQVPLPEMLSYLDIYPLSLPARYRNKTACYTKVYILSNISLNSQYNWHQLNEPETWSAFLRRINIVREFTDLGKYIDYTVEEAF